MNKKKWIISGFFLAVAATFFSLSLLPALGINADPQNTSYKLAGKVIRLNDGQAVLVSRSDTNKRININTIGSEASGDLRSDETKTKDAALIIKADDGKGGQQYYAVAALENKNDGKYSGTNGILLGEKISPSSVNIKDGLIEVKYAAPATIEENSQLLAGTQEVTKLLSIVSGALTEISTEQGKFQANNYNDSSSSQVKKDEVNTESAEDCDKIPADLLATKDRCYKKMALDNKDESICAKLSNLHDLRPGLYGGKEGCIQEVAVLKGDKTICAKIKPVKFSCGPTDSDPMYCEISPTSCYQALGGAPEISNPTPDNPKTNIETCHALPKEPSSSLSAKDRCYKKVAVENQQIKICGYMSSLRDLRPGLFGGREGCIQEVAVAQNDKSTCDLIKTIKFSCGPTDSDPMYCEISPASCKEAVESTKR